MKIELNVASFKRLETPYEDVRGVYYYVAVAKVDEIPDELDKWMEINPRDPNPTGQLMNEIAATLSSEPEEFLFRNRGLTLLAKNVEFDNKTGKVSLEFSDINTHGVADGGHTLNVILESRRSIKEDDGGEDSSESSEDYNNKQAAYIKLEIFGGVKKGSVAYQIASGRNKSKPVKTQSLMNLTDQFAAIKSQIKGDYLEKVIAFSEYELDDSGNEKPFSIVDVLAYLTALDSEHFDEGTHPKFIYSSKKQVLDFYDKEHAGEDLIKKLAPLTVDALHLYDRIYQDIPKLYNAQNGRFGNLRGVIKKSRPVYELYEEGVKSQYKIPEAYILPILAAFRKIVRYDKKSGSFEFTTSPLGVWEPNAKKLVSRLSTAIEDDSNPNSLGKKTLVWETMYDNLKV